MTEFDRCLSVCPKTHYRSSVIFQYQDSSNAEKYVLPIRAYGSSEVESSDTQAENPIPES